MKRILLSLLAVVVIAGLFAATGYAGYRLGFARGAQFPANGDEIPRPGLRPFDEFGPRGMPGRDFRFGMHGFPRMRFGFFSPFMFLGQILLLALLAGLVYWLLTRSGWRLARAARTTETPAPPMETKGMSRTNPPED